MTLTAFPPDTLDQLALRILDVATLLRQMAHTTREKSIRDFQFHGNKAEEWLDRLELWAREADSRLGLEVQRQAGMRRGQIGTAAPTARTRKPRTRKKGS